MNSGFIRDNFLSSRLNVNCYNVENTTSFNFLSNLKKPYFLTLKQDKKINKKIIKKINISFSSDLVILKKEHQSNLEQKVFCRLAKKNDISQLKKIALEKTSNSRFARDEKLCQNFRKSFRWEWLKNYFLGHRGSHLIVSILKKKIVGFLLIIKENKSWRIDLIVVKKKYQNKKVANSMLCHFIKNYMKRSKKKLICGTQSDNYAAKNFYKRNGFVFEKKIYIYHLHS